ncbi:MAG: ABC transporter permease [Candidatus Ancillula sp.]|nr:ABC transporter permease [Candidatus Ancillula sp.]
MKNIKIIAKREITTRLTSKSWIASTVFTTAMLMVILWFYSKLGSGNSSNATNMLGGNAKQIADAQKQAQADVLTSLGTTVDQYQAAVSAKASEILASMNLDSASSAATGMLIGIFVALILFMSIQVTGSQIALGVVEEKQSRVVEIILSTMSSFQLLMGKILGLAVCGIIQMVVIFGGAIAVVAALGSGNPFSTMITPELGIIALLFFIVGYFSYACLYAAFASTVSRMEEVNQAITPVMLIMMLGFFGAIFGNMLVPGIQPILKFCPFLSPLAMSGLFAQGDASLTEALISLAISAVVVPFVVMFAAKLYDRSVLQTSKVNIFKKAN